MVTGRSPSTRPATTTTTMPFFRPGPGPYALAIAMTGVRMGERFLGIGSGTPDMFGALAVKVGLSGHAAGVSDESSGAEALKLAGTRAGVLVDVQVAGPATLPYDAESFDVVVVDSTVMPVDKAAAWLPEAYRVLRSGGRLIVAERTGGFRLWGVFEFGSSDAKASEVATRLLTMNRFRPVRRIAERDGWRFTEGIKQGN